MRSSVLFGLVAAPAVHAYPWVAQMPGVKTAPLGRRQQPGEGAGSQANCPVNPNHVPAAPVTDEYPYNNAKNGLPGEGKGGFQVPADGDTAHQFVAPGPNDIRGPCPGLNTAANHNFLAHDGIVTFNELVDAQQNLYNVGYDLALLLAVLGLTTTDGDLVTEKLSIGCDATPRTSVNPTLTGPEPGLDGHNKFEADTSLTRNDFFTHDGDNFHMNGTLFGMMTDTTGGDYNLPNLALYRYQRYGQSIQENPNFYFGPFSLLLFGAASFLYELMPNGNHDYAPDLETISSFFGASSDGNGGYTFNNEEKIPDNWTNRVEPYSIMLVGGQIMQMYEMHPVLFGGATGNGGFDALSFPPSIQNGTLVAPSATSISCLLYQMATERVPSSLNGFITPTIEAIQFAATKLNPSFANFGCPLALT